MIDVDISACGIEIDNTGYLYAASRDITERKQVEAALRIAAVAFETHDAILITDADSQIVRVNRAFSEITGYSPEEVLGKNPNIMSSGRHSRDFYIEMWQQLLHEGTWSGEIWDKRKTGQIFPKWMSITAVKNEHCETTHYVAIFSDITERKRIEEEIHNLAFYDVLTKLPNRRLFLDRFRSALTASARRDDYGALLFIDLDRFKALNDSLGHDYGDLLLVEVGERIKSCVREMDTVSRFGGDEFVVLLETVSSDKDEVTRSVALVAEKVREALALPYMLKEHEHYSSPSIGISLYHGNDEPMEVLLEFADMAMYQAKNSGRNAVRFFDPVMQHTVATHDALDNDLHHAIESQQLHLHYQIQVDNDNVAIGAEAFLRWIHPEHGIIMPGQFLPIAEESTLIIDIGQWVLDTACRQLALWGKDVRTEALTLTVNISAKHFAQADFVDEVARILERHGADPHRLKLELSEKIVLTDTGNSIEKVHSLRNLGIRLSMDNFGMVYSSLSYLRQLSSDQLKIHRDFVQGITLEGNDALLVKTVVNLAKSLEVNIFAEGVETEDQLTFLKDHDCDTYQGFLFGKPVSIDEFEILMGKLQK
jgi:diguanylate cyclase (GGDEF)-like protein/PAS domain S-box-containing protein